VTGRRSTSQKKVRQKHLALGKEKWIAMSTTHNTRHKYTHGVHLQLAVEERQQQQEARVDTEGEIRPKREKLVSWKKNLETN
jgi:hypothetical protein